MKTIYITEEQRKKLKKAIAAQDQVGGKVNAGVMDAVVGGMCESKNIQKWYRGFDSKFGIRSKYSPYLLWLTNDLEYAKEYGDSVMEFDINFSKCNGSVYDLPEDIDYYDGPDKKTAKELLKQGINSYCFYANQDSSYCMCLWSDEPIVSKRILEDENIVENVDNDKYKLAAEPNDISPYYHVTEEKRNDSDIDVQEIIKSDNFKKWFGDWENNPETASKVVDKNGFPLVVYHGSPKFIGDKFDREKIGHSVNYGEEGVFCTTQDISWAKRFSYPASEGSSMFSVKIDKTKPGDILSGFLKLENPLDFFNLSNIDIQNMFKMNIKYDEFGKAWVKKIGKKEYYKKFYNEIKELVNIGNHNLIKFYIHRNLGKALKEFGYDGYIALMEKGDSAIEYCFIEPNQFKSIYSLAFNPNSDSIYESKSNINTREEKTDFGKIWYINAIDNSFRFALYKYDDDSNSLYLSNVFVEESNRRQGLGNHILSLVNDFAKKINVKEIFLKVKKGTFMCQWYKKNGYEYFSNDETDSNYIWMVKEVKQNGIIEGKKKTIKNDKGEIVPEKCDKCGGDVVLQIHGEPVYLCKDCGKYFGTMPFNLKENIEIEDKWNGEGEKLEPLKRIKNIPSILYHTSYRKNRESILKNGIYASVGEEYRDWWNYVGPNGETPDDNELEYLVFLTTKPNTWSDNFFLDRMDIYQIDTKQLDDTCFYLDPDKHLALKGSICYTGNIPASAIKLYDTVNENIELEIKPDEVDLSSFNIKKKLNPKFWIDGHLDSRIRLKLLDISDDFIDYLGIEPDIVKDVIMTGSLANFNWNEEFSDIDLHILLDYSDVDENVEFVKQYFLSQKNSWNTEHEDLRIFGFPVEVYVQDINEKHDSSGVYSLDRDKWLVEPNRSVLATSKVNKDYIRDKVSDYINKIDKLSYIYKKNKNNEYKIRKISEKVQKLWDEIKNSRKIGFEKSGGKEINNNNIIFKSLKRSGYLDKLYNLKTKTYDKLNSLS